MADTDVIEVYALYKILYKGNLSPNDFYVFWAEISDEEKLFLQKQFEKGRPHLNSPLAFDNSIHPLMRLRMMELVA